MALTQQAAEKRSRVLEQGSILYRFHLTLASQNYDGLSEISFSLLEVPDQLFLDCKAGKVHKVYINQEEDQECKHEGGFLFLNTKKLKGGQNLVAVIYESSYSKDGEGLSTYTDEKDGNKQYLYTQFEAHHANKVFPCFDQPDLKATMELSIVAIDDWSILSNEYPSVEETFSFQKFNCSASTFHPELLKEFSSKFQGKMTIFPKTKMLPTYLYCFVAGPYVRIKISEEYKGIPMSLYCIKSLEEHLLKLKDFIFEITIESLKFFQDFFGVPYSFNKYDQVFAHQYNAGAMENAGIVTFRDDYIFKGQVSTEEMLELANTISHELSHHWFGNLSTMKWWDDLWLNESFADFISHYCLEEIKHNIKTIHYDSSMVSFVTRKAWGYQEDQYSTTHPIRGDVANTVVAESIFDGITYAKGAATMQQLLFLMGKDNFSAGLKAFFTKYGFKNATLSQFIGQLQTYFHNKDLSLEQWKHYWLETPSFNVLTPVWDINAHSNCEKLIICNKPLKEEYPTIRPHKIKVAMFKEDATFDVLELFIGAKAENAFEYDGCQKYKAVLLNYGDQTFARIVFDKDSKEFFKKNVNNIPDILTRALIWKGFYDDVYSGDASSEKFLEIFMDHIEGEKSDSIFEAQFEKAYSAINLFTPRIRRSKLNTALFHFTLKVLEKVDPSMKNRLIVLRQKLIDFAVEDVVIDYLIPWRNGETEKIKGCPHLFKKDDLTLAQEWTIVVKAFANKELCLEQKQKLLEDQLKRDTSSEGENQKQICDSLRANKEEFEEIYTVFKNPHSKESKAEKEFMAQGWNHPYHFNLLKEYKKQYFSDVVEMSNVLEGELYSFFVLRLAPIDDDLQENIDGLKAIKLGPEEKLAKVKKSISNMIDRLERKKNAYLRYETQVQAKL